MTGAEDSTEHGRIPRNWDVLQDADPDCGVSEEPASTSATASVPQTLNVLASAWADAVTVLAVCTAALVGLVAFGHNGSLTALPWAAVLGTAWWTAATAILVVIRQGTPGMLLAGIVFSDQVAPRRLPFVIGAAAISALFVGLPGIFGAQRSILALAAASRLESIPAA